MGHRLSLLVIILLVIGSQSLGSSPLVPAGEDGRLLYVPFSRTQDVDGNLADWADIPQYTVARGPSISKNSAENSEFTFSLAADARFIYIFMTTVDQNIISGKHGADYWNEDSLEFYLNLGKYFGQKKYSDEVVQYRVMPKDIGNADVYALTPTGINNANYPLRAKVFKTTKGWGFEGAIDLAASEDFKREAKHGYEFGFNAHANGASEKDRNVKLIWALSDPLDGSWSDPSLFGRAIVYETGKLDLPLASAALVPPPPVPKIFPKTDLSHNQESYARLGTKTAVLTNVGRKPMEWHLLDALTKAPVLSGKTKTGLVDTLTGEEQVLIDFSKWTEAGKYQLLVEGFQSSIFEIRDIPFPKLTEDAMQMFYLHRSGLAIEEVYAGEIWKRNAGHVSDNKVLVYGDAEKVIDGSGGWYDAGDYGKYVVNGGISLWTLQNSYERKPEFWAKKNLNIPENSNVIPDILDEARWELEFLLRMQIPEGQALAGMVYHKLHDKQWAPLPYKVPQFFEGERYVYQPTTAATLNLSATAAQAARLWQNYDPAFAAKCLEAAQKAWISALKNPIILAGNIPGSGGGNYDDALVDDEFYWAASELAITTKAKEYLDFIRKSTFFKKMQGADGKSASSMSWSNTAALGTISLANSKDVLTNTEAKLQKELIINAAKKYVGAANVNYFRLPMNSSGFIWGSSSVILNNGLILGLAYDFTQNNTYREGLINCLDYLMGKNSLKKSFITSYGIDYPREIHHRFWVDNKKQGYPPPPAGLVVGGANGNAGREDSTKAQAVLKGKSIPNMYMDSVESYATNEIAINWNAPLVWVSAWLDQDLVKSK